MPIGSPRFDAVSCVDSHQCVSVGPGEVATSLDGGSHWVLAELPIPAVTLLSVSCPSSSECVAVGVRSNPSGVLLGEVLVSSTGGRTWVSPAPLPAGSPYLDSVECPSVSSCVAVGAGILTSSDGGQSWSYRPVTGGTQGDLRTVSCDSVAECITLVATPPRMGSHSVSGQVIATSSGDATWDRVAGPPGPMPLSAVSCVYGGACMVVGPPSGQDEETFATTEDGGSTWSTGLGPKAMTDIVAVECTSPQACIAVGRSGARPAASVLFNGLWTTRSILTGGSRQ